MKSLLSRSLLVTALLVAPAMARDITSAEAAALRGPAESGLLALRAGETPGARVMTAAEREALLRATAAAPGLDTLRAGEITDHDLLVICVIAAAVALIIIVA